MSSNWKEELKEAKQMLDSGLITEEHFHELREEIFQQRRKIQTPPTHSGKRNSNGESSFSSQNTTRNITNTFGSYNIFEKLGEGGMGVVYRSRHKLEAKAKVQGGDVALKLIHLDGSINQDMVERFSSEASTGMELDHPNIIKVLDFVTENTQIGIVMEIIEGESLQNIMDNRSTVFKWKEIQDWIGCICDAMSYAHSQGIVHRDIKPDNIVLDDNGKLTILDFGIAKRQNDSKKTQVGIGMGTPTYMAPEQYFNATKVDGRSDIYALAIMIVEMLTNRLPWNDQLSDDRIYQLKLNDELELEDVLRTFPEHFQVGIKKALQANPQRRQVTMYDFFEDLYPNQKKVLRKTNRTIVFNKVTFNPAQKPVLEKPLKQDPWLEDQIEDLQYVNKPMMTFMEAIDTCFSKYNTIQGRAQPSEYWWWNLFVIISLFCTIFFCAVIDGALSLNGNFAGFGIIVYSLVMISPHYCVLVRRLHDIGCSGWYLLFLIIPQCGSIILLFITLVPSQNHRNRFDLQDDVIN